MIQHEVLSPTSYRSPVDRITDAVNEPRFAQEPLPLRDVEVIFTSRDPNTYYGEVPAGQDLTAAEREVALASEQERVRVEANAQAEADRLARLPDFSRGYDPERYPKPDRVRADLR